MKASSKRPTPKTSPKTTLKNTPLNELARWYEKKLQAAYPDAHCALKHANAFELLIATILSAQCTDARVNMVTPELFKKWPTPKAMAQAKQKEIETTIRSTGFYRNKAKSILGASQMIEKNFHGQVPDTMESLLQLPGVARKTANVVLGNVFKKNVGVVVDTHVSRLSNRMGLTRQTTPEKIEQDLMQLFPSRSWTLLSHLLIAHGRSCCTARKTACEQCPIRQQCPQIGVLK